MKKLKKSTEIPKKIVISNLNEFREVFFPVQTQKEIFQTNNPVRLGLKIANFASYKNRRTLCF
jgi:hypothetical protein